MSGEWDIVVAGAGPAGCASAITLRQVAPGLRVALFTGAAPEGHRVGETLPSAARALLEHLGVWDSFLGDGHLPASGTADSWGAPDWRENDFIRSLKGHGWHLDRRVFDDRLLLRAEEAGVTVVRGVRVTAAKSATNGCHLELADRETSALATRFVIDATGRAALVGRSLGASVVRHDQLVGIYRVYEGTDREQARTLVEPCAQGWWYSAGLPGHRHLLALMTDGDLAASHSLHRAPAWEAALSTTQAIKAIASGARPLFAPRVKPAASGRLDPCATDSFLAVGDAAATFDPLSSLGITMALRSGIFGAYAAADWLTRGDASALERHRGVTRAGFNSFLKQWRRQYALEQRWAAEPFWSRRHALEPALPSTGVEMQEARA